jgi:hypothetical protein
MSNRQVKESWATGQLQQPAVSRPSAELSVVASCMAHRGDRLAGQQLIWRSRVTKASTKVSMLAQHRSSPRDAQRRAADLTNGYNGRSRC